jgi:DNA ligase-1
MTLLADLVAVTDAVGATSSRTAKRDRLAALLVALAPDEVIPAVGMLIGDPRQGRVGVGWGTLASVGHGGATSPVHTIGDLDRLLDDLQAMTGAGSRATRLDTLGSFLDACTAAEGDFVRRLLFGELRQGALEGVMTDAVAAAARVPVTAVRRAMMLSGDLRGTAAVALRDGRPGLDAVGLAVGHAVQPMLASPAESIDDIVGVTSEPVSVEWKLDGARVQVHRRGDDVQVFTRNLNDVTARLPEVVAVARSLPVDEAILDGEVLSLRDDDRPRAFQDTMSRFGRDRPADAEVDSPVEAVVDTSATERLHVLDQATDGLPIALPRGLRPFFFDVLHVDGRDLIDAPLAERLTALDDVARPHRIPGIVTADPATASAFLDEALARGHEGIMLKGLDTPYQAGRRGKAWRKVKPVRRFDLVVLAAEWGSGRRRGWLSNLHLGARDPATGSFVMVGKTFKGLTDELLTWQTAAFLEREIGRESHVVHVRPELVVEIALDGVHTSTRYPGGVALRFARVKRYREDKPAAEADTIDALRALLPGR